MWQWDLHYWYNNVAEFQYDNSKYINRFGIGYTGQLIVVTVVYNIYRPNKLNLKRTCDDGLITNKSERSNI